MNINLILFGIIAAVYLIFSICCIFGFVAQEENEK